MVAAAALVGQHSPAPLQSLRVLALLAVRVRSTALLLAVLRVQAAAAVLVAVHRMAVQVLPLAALAQMAACTVVEAEAAALRAL